MEKDKSFGSESIDGISEPLYSLVIPAYKEELIIESSLQKIHKYLSEQKLLGLTEVVVVAANGGDDTGLIAKRQSIEFPFFQLIEPSEKVGKGRDVRLGVLAAKGKYVVFTDADLATPIHHFQEALTQLEESCDVVIGVRNLKTIHKGFRSILSRATNLLTRIVALPSIPDTQCGFKGFRKSAAEKIFNASVIDCWSFDIEVLALARLNNEEIGQIYIDDWRDPKLDAGIVGENAFVAASRSLIELFQIRWNLSTGKYKNSIKK